MDRSNITKATLGRLPQYLQYLKDLPDTTKNVSATAIARGLDLGEVQVRKDLAAVSGAGKPKVGYDKKDLICNLAHCLGGDRTASAVLVGAGKLGRALLEYEGFENYGVSIIAAFDCNRQILQSGGSKEILPMDRLEPYCRAHRVSLGIITVGQGSAQTVCDQLLAAGITAIWNFAPCGLKVPDGICLKQENLALSLAYLHNQMCK